MGWRDGAEGRRRGGNSGGVEVVIVGGTSARRVREVLGWHFAFRVAASSVSAGVSFWLLSIERNPEVIFSHLSVEMLRCCVLDAALEPRCSVSALLHRLHWILRVDS